MQENTARKDNVVDMTGAARDGSGDTQKIITLLTEKVDELLPQVVSNYVNTGAKSVLTLKITLQTNKDNEAVRRL